MSARSRGKLERHKEDWQKEYQGEQIGKIMVAEIRRRWNQGDKNRLEQNRHGSHENPGFFRRIAANTITSKNRYKYSAGRHTSQ